MGVLRQPAKWGQNKIGVMEYWSGGVMGLTTLQYSNTPSLQLLTVGGYSYDQSRIRRPTEERHPGISQDPHQASVSEGREQRHRDHGSDPRLGDPRLSVSRRRAADRHDALPGLQRS